MTEKELLDLARTNLGETDIDNVKDAVLAFHGHGVADETTGEVDGPSGHVIRVDHWIVLTDSRGFTTLEDYPSEDQAHEAFTTYEREYAVWADGDPDFGDISEDQAPDAIADQVEQAYRRAARPERED